MKGQVVIESDAMTRLGHIGLALFLVTAGCDSRNVEPTKDQSVVRKSEPTTPFVAPGAKPVRALMDHITTAPDAGGNEGGTINPCFLVARNIYNRSLKKEERYQLELTLTYEPIGGAGKSVTKSFTLKLEKLIVHEEHPGGHDDKKFVPLMASLNVSDARVAVGTKIQTKVEAVKRTSLGAAEESEQVAQETPPRTPGG